PNNTTLNHGGPAQTRVGKRLADSTPRVIIDITRRFGACLRLPTDEPTFAAGCCTRNQVRRAVRPGTLINAGSDAIAGVAAWAAGRIWRSADSQMWQECEMPRLETRPSGRTPRG